MRAKGVKPESWESLRNTDGASPPLPHPASASSSSLWTLSSQQLSNPVSLVVVSVLPSAGGKATSDMSRKNTKESYNAIIPPSHARSVARSLDGFVCCVQMPRFPPENPKVKIVPQCHAMPIATAAAAAEKKRKRSERRGVNYTWKSPRQPPTMSSRSSSPSLASSKGAVAEKRSMSLSWKALSFLLLCS